MTGPCPLRFSVIGFHSPRLVSLVVLPPRLVNPPPNSWATYFRFRFPPIFFFQKKSYFVLLLLINY
jgi:hypothetical protein